MVQSLPCAHKDVQRLVKMQSSENSYSVRGIVTPVSVLGEGRKLDVLSVASFFAQDEKFPKASRWCR